MNLIATDLKTLLASPAPAVEEAALLIARSERPELDVAACLRTLDSLAVIDGPTYDERTDPTSAASQLVAHLARAGFSGDESDYYDPRNSYLDEVLRRRRGIPITLSVVAMALGRRLGWQVEGIGFPGHFLARVGGPGGVLIDPFHQRVLDQDALAALATQVLGDERRLRPELLTPVDVRAIAIRMLHNLHSAHHRRGDHTRALMASDRLYELTQEPRHLRDRGLHAHAVGAHAAAAEDLEAYLAARPRDPQAADIRRALTESKARAQRSLS